MTREYFQRVYGTVEKVTLPDRCTADFIAMAITRAESICRREKVKAVARHERVGIFVTELRRALIRHNSGSRNKTQYKSNVTRKELWFDIGVPDTNRRLQGVDMDTLVRVCNEARKIAGNPSYADQVEDSFVTLDSCVMGANINLRSALTINAEADKILESLRQTLVEENCNA